jgi:signal transduction histidine kinase
VVDDGVGFDTATAPRGSHGLMGMRFRVEAERGRFTLGSAPGVGTTVQARLPLRQDTPAAA